VAVLLDDAHDSYPRRAPTRRPSRTRPSRAVHQSRRELWNPCSARCDRVWRRPGCHCQSEHAAARAKRTHLTDEQYDHVIFPGAVPRTFVGSVLLGWLAQPVIALAASLGLLAQKLDVQVVGVCKARLQGDLLHFYSASLPRCYERLRTVCSSPFRASKIRRSGFAPLRPVFYIPVSPSVLDRSNAPQHVCASTGWVGMAALSGP
jgi:hypothetical protein